MYGPELDLYRDQAPAMNVELGVPFKPFLEARGFFPVELGKNLMQPESYLPRVLVCPIDFLGTRGTIEIYVDSRSLEREGKKETPLGKVEVVTSILDGKREASKLPLVIEVNFFPKTMFEVMDLSGTTASLRLGQRTYFADYSCDDEINEAEENIVDQEPIHMFQTELLDEKFEEVEALLPFDITAFTDVEVTFISKPEELV